MAGSMRTYAASVLQRISSEADEDGLWRGHMTKLVMEFAPPSMYSRVVAHLKGVGAIEIVDRPGFEKEGTWRVVNPDADVFGTPQSPTGPPRNTLETRVSELERLVGGIDVAQAIGDHIKGGH